MIVRLFKKQPIKKRNQKIDHHSFRAFFFLFILAVFLAIVNVNAYEEFVLQWYQKTLTFKR